MCKEYTYPNVWPSQSPACVFSVVDVETTGLKHGKDEVIEIGIVQVRVDDVNWEVVKCVNYLREPRKMPLPEAITNLTGITNAEVTGRVIGEEKVKELRGMFETSDFVVAHNAAFDRPFVESVLGKQEVKWVCSVQDVPWRDLGFRHASLEYLSLKSGLRFNGHRAWQDAHMTAFVLGLPLKEGPHACALDFFCEKAKEGVVYTVQAYGSPFAKKDVLKARGYRWNAEKKVWWNGVENKGAGQEEVRWVRENTGGKPRLESVSLTRRFR